MSLQSARQDILNCLNKRGIAGMTAAQVFAEIPDIMQDTISRHLSRMAESGECARKVDKSVLGNPFRYMALVTTALPVRVGRPPMEPKIVPKPPVRVDPSKGILGIYVHDNSKSKPNHGGQGCIQTGPRCCVAMLGE